MSSPDELLMRLRGRESSLSPRAVEKLSREGESRLSISIVLIWRRKGENNGGLNYHNDTFSSFCNLLRSKSFPLPPSDSAKRLDSS
jgi:hypothetical protein